jgi:Tol biopolymer transport system component
MKKLVTLLLAFAAPTMLGTAQAPAPADAFTLEQVLNYPFPDNLVASPKGSLIAWTFNERGVRNIFVGEGPEFHGRRLTPYQHDDGQELTNLSFAPDGRTLVYVRGGDHGANWSAEGNLQPNPGSSAVQPRMQVWSIAASGESAPTLLGEGDTPAIAPAGDRVAFVKDGRIWIAPLDRSKPAAQASFARGTSEAPAWSPDGSALALVSDRDDHGFIGIFTDASQPIRYLAASTSRDADPRWSGIAGSSPH